MAQVHGLHPWDLERLTTSELLAVLHDLKHRRTPASQDL